MAAPLEATAQADTASLDALVAAYRPLPGIFDEMMDADGHVRPHWQPFLGMLDALGGDEINHRFAAADRYLRSSGVFYRVYEDAAGIERPWPLSHVPLLIDPTEWRELEAGLVQRATLLEAVLANVYGPSQLTRDGHLPATVIAGNPEFLGPLVGVEPPGGAHLRFYAADVPRRSRHAARGPCRAFGPVLPGLSGLACRARPPRRRAHLRADAGADERDLFRARVPGALSRLSAGRGRRPERPRRRRVRAHGLRPAAHGSVAAPYRCRLHRSARAQRHLAPRRARSFASRARGQGVHGQRARCRFGGGPRHAGLPAGAGAQRAGHGFGHSECRHLVARRAGRPRRDRRRSRRVGDRAGIRITSRPAQRRHAAGLGAR